MTGDTLLFFFFQNVIVNRKIKCIKHTKKNVNAGSTQNQVHSGINNATSVLSTLVDKMFAIFKKMS